MTGRKPGWGGTFARVALAIIVIGGAALLAWRAGWFDYARAARLARQLRALHDPALAAGIFVATWGVEGTIGFPALPLLIAGGLLFGTWLGTGLNLAGTALAALGGYWVARAVARGALHRWLAAHVPVHEMTRRRGMVAVARFRLLPIVPLAVGNFAAGLAGMQIGPYLIGTLVGQLPSTVIYTYFADALVKAAVSGAKGAAVRDAALASGGLLVLSVVPRVVGALGRRSSGTADHG